MNPRTLPPLPHPSLFLLLLPFPPLFFSPFPFPSFSQATSCILSPFSTFKPACQSPCPVSSRNKVRLSPGTHFALLSEAQFIFSFPSVLPLSSISPDSLSLKPFSLFLYLFVPPVRHVSPRQETGVYVRVSPCVCFLGGDRCPIFRLKPALHLHTKERTRRTRGDEHKYKQSAHSHSFKIFVMTILHLITSVILHLCILPVYMETSTPRGKYSKETCMHSKRCVQALIHTFFVKLSVLFVACAPSKHTCAKLSSG